MKYIYYLFVLLTAICVSPVWANDAWRVLVYMDSTPFNGDLANIAIQNITDMLASKSASEVDIRIQIHAYTDVGIRYQIIGTHLVYHDRIVLSGNAQEDFMEAARWAFSGDTPADHTMVILWDHGWGILEPQWNQEHGTWETAADKVPITCPLKRSTMYDHENHRGFVFNGINYSYLTNQQMIDALAYIQSMLLNGKKLDILAFDTCMGGMLEVAYQCAPHVAYLVGNQTCSLLDGFNYSKIIPLLQRNSGPRQVAAGMVAAFDDYYSVHDPHGIYAHTALDLGQVGGVIGAMDEVVRQILHNPVFIESAMKARDESLRICMFSMYTDLICFFKHIAHHITALPASEEKKALRNALKKAQKTMQQCVVAHCAGHAVRDAMHGCAIYLPFSVIDSSYYGTLFAKETEWLSLLLNITV